MADRDRLSSHRQLPSLPVCHGLCRGFCAASRHARGGAAPRATAPAPLHDVGKAFIPVTILDKPGELSEEEMAVIRKHPRLGYEALASQGSFPPEMLDVVLHHHEFLDGSGYPNGLQGDRISDIGLLTTIVDA